MTQEMIQDITQSLEACASHYGQDADAVRNYLIQGQKRALALPNRGPIRFDENGDIHPDILTTYAKYGFYVFKNVLGEEELADIHADLEMLRDNFPTHMGAATDAQGRPALGADLGLHGIVDLPRGGASLPACAGRGSLSSRSV